MIAKIVEPLCLNSNLLRTLKLINIVIVYWKSACIGTIAVDIMNIINFTLSPGVKQK